MIKRKRKTVEEMHKWGDQMDPFEEIFYLFFSLFQSFNQLSFHQLSRIFFFSSFFEHDSNISIDESINFKIISKSIKIIYKRDQVIIWRQRDQLIRIEQKKSLFSLSLLKNSLLKQQLSYHHFLSDESHSVQFLSIAVEWLIVWWFDLSPKE